MFLAITSLANVGKREAKNIPIGLARKVCLLGEDSVRDAPGERNREKDTLCGGVERNYQTGRNE